MSAFKVNDRVRIIGVNSVHVLYLVGCEATIVDDQPNSRHPDVRWVLDIDGHGPFAPNGALWRIAGKDLAPLTDPKADAFIANIKRLKPLDAPRELTDLDLIDRAVEALVSARLTRARIAYEVLTRSKP